MIDVIFPRAVEEIYSWTNGKRLIQIETTRQVEKLMGTEKFGAIISPNYNRGPIPSNVIPTVNA